MAKTIAVDFDGVIHAYSKKWHDGTIYDEPVRNVQGALVTLQRAGYELVIYSTRCYDRTVKGVFQPNQVKEMEAWLLKHNVPYDRIHTEAGKPLCALFIDDNAYRFVGDWNQSIFDIMGILKP